MGHRGLEQVRAPAALREGPVVCSNRVLFPATATPRTRSRATILVDTPSTGYAIWRENGKTAT